MCICVCVNECVCVCRIIILVSIVVSSDCVVRGEKGRKLQSIDKGGLDMLLYRPDSKQ